MGEVPAWACRSCGEPIGLLGRGLQSVLGSFYCEMVACPLSGDRSRHEKIVWALIIGAVILFAALPMLG